MTKSGFDFEEFRLPDGTLDLQGAFKHFADVQNMATPFEIYEAVSGMLEMIVGMTDGVKAPETAATALMVLIFTAAGLHEVGKSVEDLQKKVLSLQNRIYNEQT